MENGKKALEKAKEINQFHDYLPELQIGDIVELNDVWDGNGEIPEDSYSYLLTHDGEDGESNYDVCLNYEFEVVEQKESPLDTVIKITNIDLL